VGIADRLIDTDTERVGNIDPAMVVRGEGVLVTERERVLDTVGLTDRVNGRVVGIADLLTVRDTERVIVTDTVLDTVTDTERVGNIDPAMVVRGEGVLVTERERVLDTVGLTDRVNGRVVGTADLLLVILPERVIVTDTVLDTVTDTERVGNIDPAMVVRGEGVLVTERERVLDTVGLTDRVNGRVVGTGDLLLVILPDTLRVTVTETERVANIDPTTIWRAEGDTVRERVRVTDTVGVRDRVNGCVVTNGLCDPVPHRVIVRETVGLTDRVFGPLVAIGLLLRVILTLTVRLSVVVTHRVIIERVILVVGDPDLVAICVVGFGVRVIVTVRVVDTVPVKDAVKLFTDLVAYGVVATGDGVRVVTERVNVADVHIDIVVVWLCVAREVVPLVVGEARPLTEPLTDLVKPVLDPHGLAVPDGTIVAEGETVASELEGDVVAE